MWVWVDHLGGLVFDAGVSAVVLWSVVAVAMLGCRQPVRRLQMARAALVGSLALLPLIGFGLVPRFHLFAAFSEVGLLPHPFLPPKWQSVAGPVIAPAAPPMATEGWTTRVITLLYLSGLAFNLAWLILGWVALIGLRRRSYAPSADATTLYVSLPFDSLRHRPELRVAGRVGRPVLVGVFQPLILIPPELDSSDPDTLDHLRLSLLHELAHAERADPAFGLVSNLAQAVWFFVPPLRWVISQTRLDQEFLADRRAASGFGPTGSYASSLLGFATSRFERPDPDPRSVVSRLALHPTDGSPLFQRVLMLLRCPFPVEYRPPAWWSFGLPCLTVLMTLGVSSLSVRPTALPPAGPTPVHTFRVSRLDVPANPAGTEDRSPPFDLPIRLPERFDLTLEVWADPPTLAQTRAVGLLLDSHHPDTTAPPAWHLIRVVRDRSGVSLSIDGSPAPISSKPPTLTCWLSVEPPLDLPASFRRLALTW